VTASEAISSALTHSRSGPQPLGEWSLASSAAGQWATPADIPSDGIAWLPAIVPGTVARSLRALGRWSLDAPTPLHDRDHWYRCRLTETGLRDLHLEGLATFAEVYVDGELVLVSDNMFIAHRIEIEARAGAHLMIAFRSLHRKLDHVKPKRARWRTSLIADQRLRGVRTTLLGHMPGWCPPIDTIGPWRNIRLMARDPAEIGLVRLRTERQGTEGRLYAQIEPPADVDLTGARLICGGRSCPLIANAAGLLDAELVLPDVAPWWPHTHGEPKLHSVEIEIGGRCIHVGRVGFRHIEIDRGADGQGFGLRVNGVDLFARGVVWMPADFVSLPGDRAAYLPELTRIRDAGLNMLRVPGIAAYETDAFHALCDELGILVWQDLMFANFDYPDADAAFLASSITEIEQVMTRLAASPSLAVVCGGSEITQQAAMLGLPPTSWGNRLFDEHFPACVARFRPDVAWVRSTPDGGELPFVADKGVTHYFGVGAYRRPLEDARRANVRFAAECLAFAHVPDSVTLDAHLAAPSGVPPWWKERIPRDIGADWDFEDTRQHYEAAIFGTDPQALHGRDPQLALDVARATTAHVVEATVCEWRRPGSPTRGALVLSYRDPWIGAGWGYVDALGVPKSSWYALARAARPLAIFLSDEGVNGLNVHVVNDRPQAVEAMLELTCYADGRRPVISEIKQIRVEAHASFSIAATTLIGRFFDTTFAYRFGPAAHDLNHARLVAVDGTILAEASQFPLGRSLDRRTCDLAARVEITSAGFDLVVGCAAAALSIVIEDTHFLGADNGFHLAPGERRIPLLRRPNAPPDAVPEGRVRALNTQEVVHYRVSA
jgi:beta-mannosidase